MDKTRADAEVRLNLIQYRKSEKARQRHERKAAREIDRRHKDELAAEFRERKKLAREEYRMLLKEDREKARSQRLRAKKERRRLLRYYTRSQFKRILHFYRVFYPSNLRKFIRVLSRELSEGKKMLIIAANSTALFLLSYLVLYILSMGVTVIAASIFKFPTIVYYHEIFFNVSPEAWYHDAVKTIFSAGPLLNLIIGILFITIYNRIRELTGNFKLFFLWGFLHSVNMLFGAMLVGTLFETGVGHVISWMYIMDTGRMLYSILSVFILVITGLIATKHFLFSGNAYFPKIDASNNTRFVVAQVLLPFLLGTAAMILVRQPRFLFYDTFVMITMLVMIIPVLASYRSYNDLFFEEETKKISIRLLPLIALAALLIFFRVGLEIGIRFGS